ncbi:hypothetical protein ARTHRO8AJ_300051 [Arthrobacter sp. 8AJ]|nr:hypothetical protein ARTHRO8AJ_300051 [Arthrobacter sp. 8AJ]
MSLNCGNLRKTLRIELVSQWPITK